jgi:hypothetical protein
LTDCDRFQALLDYCSSDGRICPLPRVWHEFWRSLPERGRSGDKSQAPLPLILSSWWASSDDAKHARLREQIVWASDHACLDIAWPYLTNLPHKNWLMHGGQGEQCWARSEPPPEPLSDDLIQAYRRAIFRVLPPADFVFRIGEPCAALDATMTGEDAKCAGFITASNPFSLPQDDLTNDQAHSRLIAAVEKLGLAWLPGEGCDAEGLWPAEQSLLALGASRSATMALGLRFGQNAVVWCRAGSTPELILLR